MKYIIGDKRYNSFEYYEDIHAFNDAYNMSLDDDGSWCYWQSINGTNYLPKDAEVSWYLDEVVKALSPDEIVSFSVTSREDRYKEWLDAISGVPGATVTIAQRATGSFKYEVYLCSFPVSPSLENI